MTLRSNTGAGDNNKLGGTFSGPDPVTKANISMSVAFMAPLAPAFETLSLIMVLKEIKEAASSGTLPGAGTPHPVYGTSTRVRCGNAAVAHDV